MTRSLRLGLLSAALGIGILAVGAYLFQKKTWVQTPDLSNHPQSFPNLGGPFRLQDHFGRFHTDQEFRGKFMLVYFGYTFCPDVCPLGLSNITQALNTLGRDQDQIIPLFITIDPQRDTQEFLATYSENWHPSFLFLTGTESDLAPVWKAYKVYRARAVENPSSPTATKASEDKHMSEDYLMDHSALIYLMDREGKMIECFPHTTDPAQMAKILVRCLSHSPRPR